MRREEFVRALAVHRSNEIFVTTMGAVRAWGRISRRPELDFVSADSAMGHAADLALGLALARPERRVICLNGDGSMLMNLGTLATIAASGVGNLVLVVLQNRVYELTGASRFRGLTGSIWREWPGLPAFGARSNGGRRLKSKRTPPGSFGPPGPSSPWLTPTRARMVPFCGDRRFRSPFCESQLRSRPTSCGQLSPVPVVRSPS